MDDVGNSFSIPRIKLGPTYVFVNPILYIKHKYKPIVGSYKKVKINEIRLWTEEADLKLDYFAKEIPPDIKFSMNLLITKTRLLSNSKSLKEDIAALQVSRSEKVNAKVPREIVDGFLQAHQRLRLLNTKIQAPGQIMEESAYRDYSSSSQLQELFPKSGILEDDKQNMLDFIVSQDEAKTAYDVFSKHPVIREILQKENSSQTDMMWMQVLPIMGQYLKNIEHVVSIWRARYQFESQLPIYVQDRLELENVLDGISNMGEIYLANKFSVQEGIKETWQLKQARI